MKYKYIFGLRDRIITEMDSDEPLAGIEVGHELLLQGDAGENFGLLEIVGARTVLVQLNGQVATNQVRVYCENSSKPDWF